MAQVRGLLTGLHVASGRERDGRQLARQLMVVRCDALRTAPVAGPAR
jgi:hypothetical protein